MSYVRGQGGMCMFKWAIYIHTYIHIRVFLSMCVGRVVFVFNAGVSFIYWGYMYNLFDSVGALDVYTFAVLYVGIML